MDADEFIQIFGRRVPKGNLFCRRGAGKAHAALAFTTLTLAIAQAAGLFDLGRFMTWLYALLFITVLLSAALYFVAWRRGHRRVGSDASVG